MNRIFTKISKPFTKYNPLFLIIAMIVYLVSRYAYLGEICYYMDTDELRSAFDSVCIANGSEGVLQHPSLFVIVASLMLKIKGGLFSLKLFRLISVMGGLFGMIFSYLVVLEITGQRKYAFLEAMLVATLPVFFISSRTGIPAYVSLWLAPAAFYFLIKAIRSKNGFLYAVSALFWIIIIFTMLGDGREIDLGSIPSNLINIKSLLWDDSHPFNISSYFGTIYFFSVPVLFIGMIITIKDTISSIKNRHLDTSVILLIYTVCILLFGVITADADTRSVCGLFFSASLFICKGLIWLCENIKGVIFIEIAVYLICLKIFSNYYFENFNSEVNNSPDHEAGIVVDRSIGEAIKASKNLFSDKHISVISDNFEGRNLMIALFGNASYEDYRQFENLDSFSFASDTSFIHVNESEQPLMDVNTVYIINQAEHSDIIDALTANGWGNLYLKEYTVCYAQ